MCIYPTLEFISMLPGTCQIRQVSVVSISLCTHGQDEMAFSPTEHGPCPVLFHRGHADIIRCYPGTNVADRFLPWSRVGLWG
jgi:hypothetical protein